MREIERRKEGEKRGMGRMCRIVRNRGYGTVDQRVIFETRQTLECKQAVYPGITFDCHERPTYYLLLRHCPN